MRNVSEKLVVRIKHILFFSNYSSDNWATFEIMQKKSGRARQATDENVAHANVTLCACGYKHTLTVCNNYCFSTATIVIRTRLSITLSRYVT